MSNIDVSPAALRIFRLTKSIVPIGNLLDENAHAPAQIRNGKVCRVTRFGGSHTTQAPRVGSNELFCVSEYDQQGNRIRARILTAAEYEQENQ